MAKVPETCGDISIIMGCRPSPPSSSNLMVVTSVFVLPETAPTVKKYMRGSRPLRKHTLATEGLFTHVPSRTRSKDKPLLNETMRSTRSRTYMARR